MGPQPDHIVAKERELEDAEQDLLANARVIMEAREIIRVEPLLQDCQSAKARFLAIYSLFLVTEKRAKREWHNLDSMFGIHALLI